MLTIANIAEENIINVKFLQIWNLRFDRA